MKKVILAVVIFAAVLSVVVLKCKCISISNSVTTSQGSVNNAYILESRRQNLFDYLRNRKDKSALSEIAEILSLDPDDTVALWAKGEILRRNYEFEKARVIFNKILAQQPDYAQAAISLSYIKYHERNYDEAIGLLTPLLKRKDLERENLALAYMLLGSINAKRASEGGLISKVIYGTRIKNYFEKAKELGPDLAEVRLGLGTFYLLAPAIIGGASDKAIEELKYAIKLAPDFATPHARLAQAYKEIGDPDNYNFYLNRALQLDPENEVAKEIR